MANATFTRTSVAYKQDGTLVDIGQPRYEAARFGQGIMLEEGTTNLLTANQSSVESDITGFTARTNSTIARVTEEHWNGLACLEVITNGVEMDEGAYAAVTGATLAVGEQYTGSAYVKGTGTVYIAVAEAGTEWMATYSNPVTLTSDWQRINVTRTITNAANTVLRLYVITDIIQATTFYADGLQIEKKGYATSWQIGGTARNDEGVTIPTAGIFNKGNFSIEFNIKPTFNMASDSYRVVWYCNVDAANAYGIGITPSGRLYGQTKYNGEYWEVSDTIPLQTGTIYNYCITWDGSNITVYRDGELRNSGPYTECTGPVSNMINLGEGAGFIIDDFRISNVARTLTEYQAAYNSGEPLPVDSATTCKMNFENNLEIAALDNQTPTFTRTSIAYKQDGTLVDIGQPRYEAARFGQGIMLEEGTTNLLTANQSSVESDLTGFTARSNSTIARVTKEHWNGLACLEVITNGVETDEGAYAALTEQTLTLGEQYTGSVYVKGSGIVYIAVAEAGMEWMATYSDPVTLTSEWQRINVTRTITNAANTVLRLYAITYTAQATTFYADGLQIERKEYATSWQIGGTARADEGVTIPTAGIFNKGKFSIEFNIQPTFNMASGLYRNVWYCWAQDYNDFCIGITPNGYLYAQTQYNGDYQSFSDTIPLQPGTIYNYCITWDGTNMTIYRDGDLRNYGPYTECTGAVAANMWIGSENNGYIIDDFRISNVARTLAEYQAAYNSGEPLPVDIATTCKMNFDGNIQMSFYKDPSIFTRTSVAFKQDGTLVDIGQPRYEAARFGQGIMLEEGTTNLLTANQSSVESDLTGFTARSGTVISRDTVEDWVGGASLKVVCSGANSDEGFYAAVTGLTLAVGEKYTASVYVKGIGTVYVSEAEAGDVWEATDGIPVTLTSEWQRISVTRTITNGSNTDVRIYVWTNTPQATTFYADGLQIEKKGYATSWQIGGTARNDEGVTIPTAEIFNKGNFSIEFNIEPTFNMASDAYRVVWYCNVDAANDYGIGITPNGRLYGQTKYNGEYWGVSDTIPLQTGTIYNYCITWDGANIKVYRDGELRNSGPYTECTGPVSNMINIGEGAGFIIDDFRMSNVARTLAEYQAAYSSGEPLPIDSATTYKQNFDGPAWAAGYSYDNSDHLISVNLPQEQTVTYAYDPNGNLMIISGQIQLEMAAAFLNIGNNTITANNLNNKEEIIGIQTAPAKSIIQEIIKEDPGAEDFSLITNEKSLFLELLSYGAYNLVDDWSTTNNPNGAWSYGYKTDKSGEFILYDKTKTIFGSATAWYSLPTWDNTPNTWKNTTSEYHYNIASGEVSIHPGPSQQPSVIRWTSPVSGNIPIAGHFGAGDSGAMGYFIYHNGSSIWERSPQTGDAYFSLNLDVEIGDVIDFMVGDAYWYGNTPIDVLINTDNTGLSGKNARHYCLVYDPATRRYSWVLEPVDAGTGAHMIEKELIKVNGAIPIPFDISYNSLMLAEGPLGNGWGHNYEARLVDSDDYIRIHWTANRCNTYNSIGSSQYTSSEQACRLDMLVKNVDDTYTLTRKDQSQYLFDVDGRLTQIKNGHGQWLNLAYDLSGRLNTITEPLSSRSLTLTYNANNLIESITDGLNRDITLTYDANHNLTEIEYPDSKSNVLTYDASGQVLTETDGEGKLVFENTYDAMCRVIEQKDGLNQTSTMNYDETTQTGQIITTITDRNGKSKIYTHDSSYQLIKVTDELGNETSYTYDNEGNRTSITDALDNTTTMTYDSRGNLLTITDALDNTTTMTYDSNDNLLTITNADAKTTTNTYDSSNNLTSTTDALDNTVSYDYNSDGLLTNKTLPRGGVTSYTYQNGQVRTVTDNDGVSLTYGHDAAGRLVSSTNDSSKTSYIAYDVRDNITQLQDPLNHTVNFTFDSNGKMLTKTDANGNTTTYEYDENLNLISITDALDNVTTYEYDPEGRVTSITNARNYTTTVTYDDKGRQVALTDALGHTTSMEYDEVDNVTGRYDALNKKIIAITYDALHNPLTTTDASNHTTVNEYDSLSRLTQTTNPLSQTTQFDYDELNRLTQTTDPKNATASQEFDDDGNRSAMIDADDNTLSFAYNLAGRLTQISSVTGTQQYAYNILGYLSQYNNGRSQVATNTYDDAGRLTSRTDNTGNISYTYDSNGNVLTVTDAAGTITRVYDELNRITSYTDARSNTIEYLYDEVGNLTRITYPDSKQVNYTYDAANRLITVTDWNTRVTSYSYDANNRLIKTVRPDGSRELRSYDDNGRITELKDLKSNNKIINQYNYSYDNAGKINAEANSSPRSPYSVSGKEMTYTTDNKIATYNGNNVTYDADGNMTYGPLADDMYSFSYDCRNRLTEVGATSYSYDAENNRIGVTVNSQLTSYVVNPNAALSQVLIKTDPDGTRTWYVYGLGLIGEECNGVYKNYHYDLRGSTVALTSINGTILERFQYGPYGEIQWVTGYSSIPFLYNGRDGVITDANGLYYMRARYYNPEIKRFMSRDEIIGNILDPMSLNRYAYVKGNPVMGVDPNGYDPDPNPNPNIFNTSYFDTMLKEKQRRDAIDAEIKAMSDKFNATYGVNSDDGNFDYSNIESARANPKTTLTSDIESANQGTDGRCNARQQSIPGQIWAGMTQVPGALANAKRELPGAVFNKDVGDAAKKTGGAILITAGVACTGYAALTAPTAADGVMVIINVGADVANPLSPDTFQGFLIQMGGYLYP